MSAGAGKALRRRRLVYAFQDAGATTPDRAATLDSLGERRTSTFDEMLACGVFLAAGEDRYYIDEPRATKYLARHRRRAWLWGTVLLAAFLVMLLLGLFH